MYIRKKPNDVHIEKINNLFPILICKLTIIILLRIIILYYYLFIYISDQNFLMKYRFFELSMFNLYIICTYRGVGKFKRRNRSRLCPTVLYTNLVSLRIIGAFTIHYWIWTIQRIRNAKTTKYIHVWDTELAREIEWYPEGNFISSFGRKLKITRD